MGGYWEPHTSSIDFCESNYLHSHHIVEFHNTWSSIAGIALFGAIGLLCGNPTKELRFTVAYLILILVGMGSSGLHGTLHWVFQSSDELPMIYQILSLIYLSLELESPTNEPKYPSLPFYLFIISIANTLIYYKFQDLYIVFIVTFSLGLSAYVGMVIQMIYNGHPVTKNPISRKIVKIAMYTYFVVATPIWCFDMFCCQWTLDNIADNMYGVTPHIIWHFTAGYGAYCTIVYQESFRMQILQREFDVMYLLGFVPVIISGDRRMMKKFTKED